MAVDTYVASLAALGLPRLQEEPARLAAEASSVEAAIAEVSLTNYEVFIENYHCVEHAKAQVASITGRANSLGIALAQLRAVCGDFKADAAALISAHRRNRQTLQHHMQVRGRAPTRSTPEMLEPAIVSAAPLPLVGRPSTVAASTNAALCRLDSSSSFSSCHSSWMHAYAIRYVRRLSNSPRSPTFSSDATPGLS